MSLEKFAVIGFGLFMAGVGTGAALTLYFAGKRPEWECPTCGAKTPGLPYRCGVCGHLGTFLER